MLSLSVLPSCAICVSLFTLFLVFLSSQKLLEHSHIPIQLYFVYKNKWKMSRIKNQKTEILNRYMKKAKQLESGQQKLPRKQAMAQMMECRCLFNMVFLVYCLNSKPDTVGNTNTILQTNVLLSMVSEVLYKVLIARTHQYGRKITIHYSYITLF